MSIKNIVRNAVAAAVIGISCASTAQAAIYTEDFEGDFPVWENNWFGINSNARNYYCNGAINCSSRGNNPDGLWISDPSGGSTSPVSVVFNSAFGSSLNSFQLDIAGYTPSTLTAYDMANNLIFSQLISLGGNALTDPGNYSTYLITSLNGISHIDFSGAASGNTSIDNLVAVTGRQNVPEPASLLLFLSAAGVLATVRRRKAA